jgi:hypothetical protein
MGRVRIRHLIGVVSVVIIGITFDALSVFAVNPSSENYQISEIDFGGGGTVLDSCSEEYCSKATIGNMEGGKVGNGTSSAMFGPVTPGEPLLEVVVDPGQSDLGVLSTEKTATKTMVVRVRNYLSNGYIMQIVGDPPKTKDHTLYTPTMPTASMKGNEQFAINLTTNTIPIVGAPIMQVPSSQTSFGEVTDNYKVTNLFKYTSGDVVARSYSESGRTDYTVSMIINVANSTPAGNYMGDFSAIITPVY